MKKHLLKTLFVCLFTLVGTTAFAYDCEVDGIYYNLNKTDQTASVTYKTYQSLNYSGAVHIPEKVVYGGTTYSVTSIGDEAFWCCILWELTIPTSVTSIGDGAFYECRGLTELTIPTSVTSIGDYAFSRCSGLTKLTIPNSVTSIGNFAFDDCRGLTKLTIGNSVTSIGNGAFQSCRGLTELTIPTSVISIGDAPFRNCSGLETIVVETGNPYYDSRESCNAIICTDTNSLIAGCKNTHIPNGVTSIGDYAFSGCNGLTKVTIPNSVTSIGSSAFLGCSGLTEVTIPNSVPSIGRQSFAGCSGLTKVTIGNCVTSIGFLAFGNCNALTEVISLSTTPPTISSNAFTTRNATLHVPAGCKDAYVQAAYWKDFFSNILEDALTSIVPVAMEQQPTTDAIYTLDGVKLNATSWQDLPSGIYIVNGKKVSVK